MESVQKRDAKPVEKPEQKTEETAPVEEETANAVEETEEQPVENGEKAEGTKPEDKTEGTEAEEVPEEALTDQMVQMVQMAQTALAALTVQQTEVSEAGTEAVELVLNAEVTTEVTDVTAVQQEQAGTPVELAQTAIENAAEGTEVFAMPQEEQAATQNIEKNAPAVETAVQTDEALKSITTGGETIENDTQGKGQEAKAEGSGAAGIEAAGANVRAAENAPVFDLSGAVEANDVPTAREALHAGLAEQIEFAATTGKNELYIQLKPDTLGGLTIQLAMTEEGVKAQVRTTNQDVQQLVTAQLYQLEETLKERGITVVSMEVIYDAPANNQMLDQRGQRQGWGEGRRRSAVAGIAGIAGGDGLEGAYGILGTEAIAEDQLSEQGVEFSA